MSVWNPYSRPLEHPVKTLALLFVLWKALLLGVAVASPGPGYDTSTQILLRASTARAGGQTSFIYSLGERLALKLMRWDAIYFVKSAERGYLNEQDWAFSWACTRFIRLLARAASPQAGKPPVRAYIWAGVAISHVSHLLSVLVLHRLFIRVQNDDIRHRSAFLAAVLHIVTPAGLFLSAPYGEALFSFLNFSGMLLYVESRIFHPSMPWDILRGCQLIGSGALFAMAALIRSNGVLSGLIFVYDVVTLLPRLLSLSLGPSDFRRLLFTTIAGSLILLGFAGPQWLAYDEYCGAQVSSVDRRPWCSMYVPSIYSWVQSYYWDVGFLRYWTISNLPLFLIAAPLMWALVRSAVLDFENKPASQVVDPVDPQSPPGVGSVKRQSSQPSEGYDPDSVKRSSLRRLALPQLVLSLVAFTSFHIQIINRIASGYPVWYLWLARDLSHSQGPTRQAALQSQASIHHPTRATHVFVRWMMMYAIVQGSLFANFLPPA